MMGFLLPLNLRLLIGRLPDIWRIDRDSHAVPVARARAAMEAAHLAMRALNVG